MRKQLAFPHDFNGALQVKLHVRRLPYLSVGAGADDPAELVLLLNEFHRPEHLHELELEARVHFVVNLAVVAEIRRHGRISCSFLRCSVEAFVSVIMVVVVFSWTQVHHHPFIQSFPRGAPT